MDEKSCNDESKPKITRSAARHIRRKRLVSAKRAAENGSSTLEIFDLEPSNDTTNPENQGEVQSLSKSKARRLRRRKKIESDKNLKTNIEEKKDIDSSPNATTGEPINKKTTANEQELFENEKNRQISECSINNKILRTIDDPEIRSEIIEEIAITRETRVSSNRENRVAQSNGNVGPPNLRTQSSIISATREQNILRMNSQEKTREQIKAEREAKKAAKAAAKSKGKSVKPEIKENASSTECKTEVSKAKEVNETRGDVVDGEIIAKINKTAVASICTKKPEIVATELHAESKNEVKSKSELRAERRAKQEAQRAAKQVVAPEKPKLKVVNLIKVTNVPVKKIEDPVPKIAIPIITKNAHEVNLFKHLYHEREQARINAPIVNSNIHPAIVRLGVQYADKVIVGSNARCVALLAAVKQLIQDFERPSQADFTRGLEASLQETSTYLHHCRPLAVSMQNALKHLKWQMTQLSTTTSDEDAKTKLGNAIDTYIQEQILLADKAISITIQTKISNGDVILTYGYSSLICKILCDAHDTGRQFRVVVVDGRPWLEGREQLRRLAKHGLECSYVLINALSFIMPEVSKVFLGAHAILANGAVMSRVGTAQVALMAKSFNVPVLVACETHKTCERVQTDSIVYNEIADADKLAENLMGSTKKTSLINWRGKKLLNLLNITYDVTPADLVTAVVTELAILPCTSVPVILRIKPSEI